MSYPLFLADFDEPALGQRISLTGQEAHHAVAVRRIRVGETILIADGQGRAVQGLVTLSEKGHCEIEVSHLCIEPQRPYHLVAVQALAKGDRAELAVELLTETGADEILAWSAERSVVKWEGQRGDRSLAKWAATARAATKQSRRFSLPAVSHVTTKQLLERISTSAALVLHESASTRLVDAVSGFTGDEIIVITGPEGGLSARELAAFADVGASSVRLTDHVLRTSSAGGIALAQLQAVLG